MHALFPVVLNNMVYQFSKNNDHAKHESIGMI